MTSRRSSRWSTADPRAGFSLIELLVTLVVSGVVLASAVTFFATHARHLRQHAFRIEAQQAMRASLDAMTRDLRLAGACLPAGGQFISLTGTNVPGGDSVTIRTGLVRPNLSCLLTSTTVDAPAGVTTVTVADPTDFQADMFGYIRDPNGSGEIIRISGVGGGPPPAPGTITFATATGQIYPQGSGVYGIDERTYAIDATNPDIPILTLTVNRAAPEAFAAGVSNLQIRYLLDRNCPACDEIDLPGDTATWRLVNEVRLTAWFESIGEVRPEDESTLVASSNAKPRNLLP